MKGLFFFFAYVVFLFGFWLMIFYIFNLFNFSLF